MFYARIFLSGGSDAVKAKWAEVKQMKDPRLDAKAHRHGPVYWIWMAVIIALCFLAVPEARQELLDWLR